MSTPQSRAFFFFLTATICSFLLIFNSKASNAFGVMKQLASNGAPFTIDPFGDDEPILHNGNILTESPLRFNVADDDDGGLSGRSASGSGGDVLNNNNRIKRPFLFDTFDKKLFVQFPQFGPRMSPLPPPGGVGRRILPDTLIGRSPDMVGTFPAGLGPRGILQAAPTNVNEAPGRIVDSIVPPLPPVRKVHNVKPGEISAQIETLSDVDDAAADVATEQQVAARQQKLKQRRRTPTTGWNFDDNIQRLMADGSAVPYKYNRTYVNPANDDTMTQYGELELLPPPPSVLFDSTRPQQQRQRDNVDNRRGHVRTHHRFAADAADNDNSNNDNNRPEPSVLQPGDEIASASLANYFHKNTRNFNNRRRQQQNQNRRRHGAPYYDTDNFRNRFVPPATIQAEQMRQPPPPPADYAPNERQRQQQQTDLSARTNLHMPPPPSFYGGISTDDMHDSSSDVGGGGGGGGGDENYYNFYNNNNNNHQQQRLQQQQQQQRQQHGNGEDASLSNSEDSELFEPADRPHHKIIDIDATQPSSPRVIKHVVLSTKPSPPLSPPSAPEAEAPLQYPHNVVQHMRGPVAYKVGYRFDSL